MDTSIMSEYADIRSRGRSPQRARASREKYRTAYYQSPVSPQSRRGVPQLDMYPHRSPTRGPQQLSDLVPVMAHEAPVVIPSKRALWLEVRDKKVPARSAWDKHEFARDARMERAANLGAGLAGDFELRRHVRRACNRKVRWTLRETSAAGLLKALDQDEGFYNAMGYNELHGDPVDTAQVAVDSNGNVDLQDAALRDEDARAWRQIQMERGETESVDALMDLARQKFELRNMAKAKKLEAQGWDWIETSAILSPRTEWAEGSDKCDGDGFELV